MSFDTQGGSKTTPITIVDGSSITLSAAPTKEGYTFGCWYLDSAFTVAFDNTVGISEDITLYAKWICKHTPVIDIAVEPDCTHTGLTEGQHCSKCDEILVEQEIVPAIEHTYGEWIDVIPATCTQTGIKGHYECSVCHKYFDKDKYELSNLVLKLADHNYDNGYCTECGEPEPDKSLAYTLSYDQTYYSVTGIGTYTDTDTEIVIPSTYNNLPVKEIAHSAFYRCKGITSVTIGDNVTDIGKYAFYECSNLTRVIISDSVTSIDNFAFDNCNSLTTITLPKSITKIGYAAFEYCSRLTTINYAGTKAEWAAVTKGRDWDFQIGKYTIVYNYTEEE